MFGSLKDGFQFVPCPSNVFHSPYCTQDLVEYFHDGAPDENITGYLTAPWVRTKVEKLDAIKDAINACALMVWDDTDKAMNDYNSKKREVETENTEKSN